MIAGRLPRPWQLSALARGSSLLWVRGQPAVGPSSPAAPSSPPTPDNADVVGPPWRGPDHIWLWLGPDNPALSAPRTSPGPAALALRGDVWHILHSPELPFTGWFIWHWTLQICVIYCRRIIDYFYIKPRKLIYLHKTIDLVVVISFFPILTGILKSLPPYFLDFPLKQKW